MKTCSTCGHLFVDDDLSVSSPAEELAKIFIESTGLEVRSADLCPEVGDVEFDGISAVILIC